MRTVRILRMILLPIWSSVGGLRVTFFFAIYSLYVTKEKEQDERFYIFIYIKGLRFVLATGSGLSPLYNLYAPHVYHGSRVLPPVTRMLILMRVYHCQYPSLPHPNLSSSYRKIAQLCLKEFLPYYFWINNKMLLVASVHSIKNLCHQNHSMICACWLTVCEASASTATD